METTDTSSPRDESVKFNMWTVCNATSSSGMKTAPGPFVPSERNSCLKTLARAFLDLVQNMGASMPDLKRAEVDDLRCPLCFCVFYQPVTLPCGHSYCRRCIVMEPGKVCLKCSAKVPVCLETNVLIKTLVEKWWPSEVHATRLCDEAYQLLQETPEMALAKCDAAISLAPNNAQFYYSRSQVLYQLNRLQDSLSDADITIKLRPHWSKAYYRKGMVLSALSRYDEALIAFGICGALDKNSRIVSPEVNRLLHKLLNPNSFGKSRRYSCSYLFNSSDCEETSSGEEYYMPKFKQPQAFVSPVRILLDRIFQEVDKIKRMELRTVPLDLDTKCVEQSDFDCILCCRTLWQPVTTPCGHTYCLVCLERCLDYSSSCPLCMTSLADYLVQNQKQVTYFIEKALIKELPAAYAARMLLHSHELTSLERAPDIPVFVCTVGFPTVSCPLFVFEPRYRLLVRRCVESGTRQFGMAASLNGETGVNRYADVGTMLEIKDWVLRSDGCSILSTVGVRRFKVISKGERDGYDTAQVQFIKDTPISPENLQGVCELHDYVLNKGKIWFNILPESIRTEILRTFGKMPELESDWITLSDGPSWSWWLLSILPLATRLQVSILETTCLEKRLRFMAKTLDHIIQQHNLRNLFFLRKSPPLQSTPSATSLPPPPSIHMQETL